MRWAVAVAALVLVGVPGCTERGFDPIPSAGWMAGYKFQYAGEMHQTKDLHSTDPKFMVGGDDHDESGDLYAYTVLSTTATVDGVPVYLLRATKSADSPFAVEALAGFPLGTIFSGNQLLAVRQSDLRGGLAFVFPGFLNSPAKLSASLSPTLGILRFPLQQGQSWEDGNATSGGVPDTQSSTRVGGLAAVDGPGGKVDAVHIRSVSDAGGDVLNGLLRSELEREGDTVRHLDISFSSTHDVYFAPSLHNVVRDEGTSEVTMDIDATGSDGHAIQVSGTVSSSFAIRLTSATLQPATDLSLEAIARGDLPAPIGNVTVPPVGTSNPPTPGSGDSGSPQPASLQLVAARTEVQAGGPQGDSVRFTTYAQGVTGLGHTVTNAAGTVLSQGTGGDFSYGFDTPGRYGVLVSGTASDGRTLASKAEVAVSGSAHAAGSCPPVSTGDACSAFTFEVGPGLQSLVARADVQSGAGLPPSGTLTLDDGHGTTWSADVTSSRTTLEVRQFDHPGTWSLTYTPKADVFAQVDYVVDFGAGYGVQGSVAR